MKDKREEGKKKREKRRGLAVSVSRTKEEKRLRVVDLILRRKC
jgi:hypothetical protein